VCSLFGIGSGRGVLQPIHGHTIRRVETWPCDRRGVQHFRRADTCEQARRKWEKPFGRPGRGAPAAPSPRPIEPGQYRGHITLDRTRLAFDAQIAIDGANARLDFQTANPTVVGHSAGRVAGDSIVARGQWTFEAQHCSGSIELRGVTTNGGGDIIGELEYLDGCADGRMKPGTFALRRVAKGS
jgi:hypothetical protein